MQIPTQIVVLHIITSSMADNTNDEFLNWTLASSIMNYSSENNSTIHIVNGTVNSVSVLVCLLAAILVCALRLYKKVVYRLALYQVLSSLTLATVAVMQTIFVNYSKNPEFYARVCIAVGYFVLYAEWMKLLFTMWVTFHLFCFAVLHKNLKKLEVLYVVTSLLVPALIAVVPLITKAYGRSPDGIYCYIYVRNNVASIERFALWDGPSMTILLAVSTAMVVMVIKLASKVCSRSKYEPITDGDQYYKALQELLPLAAFPVLFFILQIPALIYHIYVATGSTPNETLSYFASSSLWTMTSGGALLIHIIVVKCFSLARKRNREHGNLVMQQTISFHNPATAKLVIGSSMKTRNSVTQFSFPPSSI